MMERVAVGALLVLGLMLAPSAGAIADDSWVTEASGLVTEQTDRCERQGGNGSSTELVYDHDRRRFFVTIDGCGSLTWGNLDTSLTANVEETGDECTTASDGTISCEASYGPDRNLSFELGPDGGFELVFAEDDPFVFTGDLVRVDG